MLSAKSTRSRASGVRFVWTAGWTARPVGPPSRPLARLGLGGPTDGPDGGTVDVSQPVLDLDRPLPLRVRGLVEPRLDCDVVGTLVGMPWSVRDTETALGSGDGSSCDS